MTLKPTQAKVVGDYNKHSILDSSHLNNNKFIQSQKSEINLPNKTAPNHQQQAVFKPSSFKVTPQVMGFGAPIRTRQAPRMSLDDVDRVMESKLPVVNYKNDADAFNVDENYLDDEFAVDGVVGNRNDLRSNKGIQSPAESIE